MCLRCGVPNKARKKVRVYFIVCVCLCERERERAGTLENVIVCVRCGEEKSDWERVYVREIGKRRDKGIVYVCLSVCVCIWVRDRERDRDNCIKCNFVCFYLISIFMSEQGRAQHVSGRAITLSAVQISEKIGEINCNIMQYYLY